MVGVGWMDAIDISWTEMGGAYLWLGRQRYLFVRSRSMCIRDVIRICEGKCILLRAEIDARP